MGIQSSLTHSPALFRYMPLGEGGDLLPLTDQREVRSPPRTCRMVDSMVIATEEQGGWGSRNGLSSL